MANKNKEEKFDREQRGFAILMVIFIISLATIIVTAFTTETFSFLKRSRAATDAIAADYAAQSALEIALSVLEIPDEASAAQQPWQILNSLPSLPIEGFNGDVRVQIVDLDSLLNVNAIISLPGQNGQNANNSPGQDNGSGGSSVGGSPDFWRFALVTLFNDLSYTSFGIDGSASAPYTTPQQIALLTDFLDYDQEPFSSDNFPAKGIEGPNTRDHFLNRPLQLVDELAQVPGISPSFLQIAAPYLRAGAINDYKININTAPAAVLKAIGLQDTELNGILDKRQVQQITPQELEILLPSSSAVAKAVTTKSNNYKILVRSKSVSATRWLEAECVVQTGFNKKIASLRRSRVL